MCSVSICLSSQPLLTWLLFPSWFWTALFKVATFHFIHLLTVRKTDDDSSSGRHSLFQNITLQVSSYPASSSLSLIGPPLLPNCQIVESLGLTFCPPPLSGPEDSDWFPRLSHIKYFMGSRDSHMQLSPWCIRFAGSLTSQICHVLLPLFSPLSTISKWHSHPASHLPRSQPWASSLTPAASLPHLHQ